MKIKKDLTDIGATLLGILTSVCTALAVIDFSTFDIKKDYLKVIVIAIPAIGGYVSKIKNNETKN